MVKCPLCKGDLTGHKDLVGWIDIYSKEIRIIGNCDICGGEFVIIDKEGKIKKLAKKDYSGGLNAGKNR